VLLLVDGLQKSSPCVSAVLEAYSRLTPSRFTVEAGHDARQSSGESGGGNPRLPPYPRPSLNRYAGNRDVFEGVDFPTSRARAVRRAPQHGRWSSRTRSSALNPRMSIGGGSPPPPPPREQLRFPLRVHCYSTSDSVSALIYCCQVGLPRITLRTTDPTRTR